MVELIFIGSNFYWKSGTQMSSIYNVNGEREDWGTVQLYLEKGEKVSIRPANKKEMECAEKMLNDIMKKRKK